MFGLYRMRIAFRNKEQDARAREKKGLYSLPRRTHFLFGILYLILGGFLVATGLGIVKSPFRHSTTTEQKAPASAPTSPASGAVEVETR